MAYPTVLEGKKVFIALGDGASPTEVFTNICGAKGKGINQTTETTTETIYDCTDGNAPPRKVRVSSATDWSFEAEGQFLAEHRTTIQTVNDAAQPRNYRIISTDPAFPYYRQGRGIMTSLNTGFPNDGICSFSFTIEASGALGPWTANA